jgi:hypothetical protein
MHHDAGEHELITTKSPRSNRDRRHLCSRDGATATGEDQMKTRLLIALGIVLGGVSAMGVAQRAEAAPLYSRIATYYFDAAHTQYAGWQQLASCTPPYGVQPVHGTKTAYYEVDVEPCS